MEVIIRIIETRATKPRLEVVGRTVIRFSLDDLWHVGDHLRMFGLDGGNFLVERSDEGETERKRLYAEKFLEELGHGLLNQIVELHIFNMSTKDRLYTIIYLGLWRIQSIRNQLMLRNTI